MKFSATISDSNTFQPRTEKRGAGRAANVLQLPNYTADILLAENSYQLDGMSEIAECNVTSATSLTTENNGYSVDGSTENIKALQLASTANVNLDEHGVPKTYGDWLIIIERHCRLKYHGLSWQEYQLRKRRLELLAADLHSDTRNERDKVASELYEITKNKIFKTA